MTDNPPDGMLPTPPEPAHADANGAGAREPTGAGVGSSRAKRWLETLRTGAVHAVVAHVLLGSVALATTIWSIVERVPVVVWAIAIAAIALLYFVLLDLQYYFRGDIEIKRKLRIHAVLLLLFVAMLMAPIAMVQSINNAQTETLTAQQHFDLAQLRGNIQRLEHELEERRQTRQTADEKRFTLYMGLFHRVLSTTTIAPNDLKDLLNDCLTSVTITNENAARDDELRAAVFYRRGDTLYIPPGGYAGYRLHQDIEQLRLDLSPQGDTPWEKYCQRIGVAGFCYSTGKEVNDKNVQTTTQPYCYKPIASAIKEPADQSMICVPIYDPTDAQGKRKLGVLSISSLRPGVFSERDMPAARFFAMLLGKFLPLKTGNNEERQVQH
jgi:hypothetical protein